MNTICCPEWTAHLERVKRADASYKLRRFVEMREEFYRLLHELEEHKLFIADMLLSQMGSEYRTLYPAPADDDPDASIRTYLDQNIAHVTEEDYGVAIVRCPFHFEGVGGMAIYTAEGRFKCFGCGKAGRAQHIGQNAYRLHAAEAGEVSQ